MRKEVLLLLLLSVIQNSYGRVTMLQQQSCYYKPLNKELRCECPVDQPSNYLHLKLEYFVRNAGQEIRSVTVTSCTDLLIGLDFENINPSNLPFSFVNSGNVTIDFIKFDIKYTERQKLELIFNNIAIATLNSLHVAEPIQMTVDNVKEFRILKSTFTHVPALGINVSRTNKLEIRDSIFLRVYSRSVSVVTTKDVEIINNEFSINAIKVINTRDGSHLFISCNRLLGLPITPECLPTTTTMSTTTTRRVTTTTPVIAFEAEESRAKPSQNKEKSNSLDRELVVGLVSGVTLVFLALLGIIVALCVRDRSLPKGAEEVPLEDSGQALHPVAGQITGGDGNASTQLKPPPTPPPMPNFDYDHLLSNGYSNTEDRPKMITPVWLDEIQNNKIFNKQKKKLLREVEGKTIDVEVEESVDQLELIVEASELADINNTKVIFQEDGEGLSGQESVPRESSRTESDQESHTSV